jgi:hypothetical protein
MHIAHTMYYLLNMIMSFPLLLVVCMCVCAYVCRIFLAFSNFMEMHGLMANYRIGILTMKVRQAT